MPVARMRMRPWLEKMIDSHAITGLTWVDKEKTMFSIPWKHAARHGWELDKDASLFKEWAIHTGKYVEGQTCDPKTWKANFRCAMNSLPDIEEVKDKSINKGHQAVRVFRMLPSTPKSRDKRSKGKETRQRKKSSAVKMEQDTEDFSDTQSPTAQSVVTQEDTIDSTVHTEAEKIKYYSPSEIPDWCSSVEIDSSTITHRFEVSPEHSIVLLFQICEQLEKGSDWTTYSDSIFLSNEAGTSPGSLWSETSSDDLEENPQYTVLDGPIPTDFWNNFVTAQSGWE
ncbi:uncharacterized protein V6R79_000819 [Siganus canaliculatus]